MLLFLCFLSCFWLFLTLCLFLLSYCIAAGVGDGTDDVFVLIIGAALIWMGDVGPEQVQH